jgi:beta-glucanase (GH16 family)
MKVTYNESFIGPAGSSVNRDEWYIVLAINTNNDVQTYTDSNANLQLSGGETLQIIPRKSPQGHWTSGRIESKELFTPPAGKKFMIQGMVRVGSNPSKQGIWPAFWLMGDSLHYGTGWPTCGELDIFEQINGAMTAYGTIHCGTYPGGVCNEPIGRVGSTSLPNHDWHTWSLLWDRTSNNWRTESMTWMRDGESYFRVTGSDIGEEAVWGSLAHSPMFVLINVAVGGDWPVCSLLI